MAGDSTTSTRRSSSTPNPSAGGSTSSTRGTGTWRVKIWNAPACLCFLRQYTGPGGSVRPLCAMRVSSPSFQVTNQQWRWTLDITMVCAARCYVHLALSFFLVLWARRGDGSWSVDRYYADRELEWIGSLVLEPALRLGIVTGSLPSPVHPPGFQCARRTFAVGPSQ
ncbi:hypothetical protein MVEN_01654800 [Mycena venus]|uniref:Uncharacterized protein n=1 Tax=Mycena venus TaxID=2733690 RepID=A0A8H6XQJ1_9AGAR|nr:hypothetical protein MVEN_01654800 [Mycena venus]